MPEYRNKCISCKGFFSAANSWDDKCPECRRNAAIHENNKKLQENQHKNASQLKEKELRHQKSLLSEQLQNQERLEEYKINEHRKLQEEHLTKVEIVSIKDKVYSLAVQGHLDNEDIRKRLKLLLQQHSEHCGFIYKSVMELGPPYNFLLHEILGSNIKKNIENSFENNSLTFSEKAVKYFMPDFKGYEFEVFKLGLIDNVAFNSAVSKERNNIVLETNELIKLKNKKHGEFGPAKANYQAIISSNIQDIDSKEKSVKIFSFIFGNENVFLPRTLIYVLVLYYFFVHPFFSLKLLIAIIGGYLVHYLIVIGIRKTEGKISELHATLSSSEGDLRTFKKAHQWKQEDLTHEINNKKNIVEKLDQYRKS